MWIIGTVADAYLLTQMIFELSGNRGLILFWEAIQIDKHLISTIQTTS